MQVKIHSLTNKIKLSLIAGFVAAIALTLLIVQLYLGQDHYEELQADSRRVNQNIIRRIDAHFEHGRFFISKLAPMLLEQDVLPDQAALLSKLNTAKASGFFQAFSLLDLSGNIKVSTGDTSLASYTSYLYEHTLRQAVTRKQLQITEILLSASSGRPTLFFIAPVLNRSGELLALLQGRYDLEDNYFLQRLQDEFVQSGSALFLIDVDTQHVVLAHNSSDIYQPLTSVPQADLLKHILLRSEAQGETEDSEGGAWLFSKTQDPITGWMLLQLTDKQQAFYYLYQTQLSFSLILATMLTLLAVMLTYSLRKHMQPLARLIEQLQQRIRDKNMLQPLPVPQYAELKPLVNSINELLNERKRQEQVKDDFLAMVSHELRTPLTSIKGSLAFLQADNPTQQRLLQVAYRNTDRAVLLVSDLLDLAAIAKGDLRLQLGRFDPAYLIEQSREEIMPLAKAKEIQVHFVTDQRCPLTVQVDPERFKQVMTNLLSNAIKFSESNSRIDITLRQQSDRVRIGVKDEGSGIPAHYQPYIFQRFSRAQQSNIRESEGSGLGLAISKELVHAMSGELRFYSIDQEGSYFFFELPLMSPVKGEVRCL